ncbi:ATP synthase F1 subunit delta [bacterium]|nr:ATP synthase F1 subunit delta [bacterium]MBU1073719.1 ATP synthase F1 subunit delta [bacterium]MBU1676846.1 ATP synthase F1 subunit delta [bacterium]
MRDRGVATRYAQALLDTSRKAGLLEGVAESYAAVAQVFDQKPELARFLEGPQVADREKEQLLDNLFDRKIEPVLLHFFHLLLAKGRIEHLSDIQSAFQTLVEIDRGYMRARVVTAVPLPGDLERDLVDRLASLTGKRITLRKRVDPSVIGGVCVSMGDQVIDGTIQTNLTKMRAQLSAADVRRVAEPSGD